MSRWEDMTDQELMHSLWDAQEEQNGRIIKAIKREINKRWRYE